MLEAETFLLIQTRTNTYHTPGNQDVLSLRYGVIRHISISIHHIQKLQQCHNIAHHNYESGFSLNYGSGLFFMVVHSINFYCPCRKMEHIKGVARVAKLLFQYCFDIISSTFECRDQPIMFIVSPIMLCCTAQIVYILCKYCWSILTYYTQYFAHCLCLS